VETRRLDAEAVAREVIALDQQLTRLTLQFSRDVIPESAYIAARDEVAFSKGELEVRHAKLVLAAQESDAGPLAADLLMDWEVLSPGERRTLLRKLVRVVEVLPGRPRSEVQCDARLGSWVTRRASRDRDCRLGSPTRNGTVRPSTASSWPWTTSISRCLSWLPVTTAGRARWTVRRAPSSTCRPSPTGRRSTGCSTTRGAGHGADAGAPVAAATGCRGGSAAGELGLGVRRVVVDVATLAARPGAVTLLAREAFAGPVRDEDVRVDEQRAARAPLVVVLLDDLCRRAAGPDEMHGESVAPEVDALGGCPQRA
jgi:hypothetical protein